MAFQESQTLHQGSGFISRLFRFSSPQSPPINPSFAPSPPLPIQAFLLPVDTRGQIGFPCSVALPESTPGPPHKYFLLRDISSFPHILVAVRNIYPLWVFLIFLFHRLNFPPPFPHPEINSELTSGLIQSSNRPKHIELQQEIWDIFVSLQSKFWIHFLTGLGHCSLPDVFILCPVGNFKEL